MTEIPAEAFKDIIAELEKSANSTSQFDSYATITKDGEKYRYYRIDEKEDTCDKNYDDEMSPKSAVKTNSIKYWFRYCSFATLMSVVNLANGWSTGIILPSGPKKLPVIYIPFTVLKMKWGFIVLGLAQCGIYPAPFILFNNLSNTFEMVGPNPAKLVKNEINGIKNEITQLVNVITKKLAKNYLDDFKSTIDSEQKDIDTIQQNIPDIQSKKPKEVRT